MFVGDCSKRKSLKPPFDSGSGYEITMGPDGFIVKSSGGAKYIGFDTMDEAISFAKSRVEKYY